MSARIHFVCPSCGAQHDRGFLDGVCVFRCFGCGYHRTRIANKYGMWVAFLSHVIESSGAALDECAHQVGLERIVVPIPTFEGEFGDAD